MATSTLASDASARAFFAEGVRLHLGGNLTAAAAAYRRSLAASPTIAEAWNNLGTLLARDGDADAARLHFVHAVALKADYGEALSNLGIHWAQRGDHARALESFQRAAALEPARPEWLNGLANALVEHFRFSDAMAAYDRAIALEPHNPEFWANRSIALRGLRRPDDAIASLQRALKLAPAHVEALCNLGVILKEQKRFAEAIDVFERAVRVAPDLPTLWVNYAAVHEMQGDYTRLRALASRALALDPSFPEAHNILANGDMEEGAFAQAEARYQRVLSTDPGNRNANWNLALLWLLRGDFERGWTQYEWRKRIQSVVVDHFDYPGGEWNGEPLAGRAILLHSEQGIGDAIQFVRYAAVLKERGAGAVYVECPYPIAALLSGVEGVDGVVARGLPLPTYDVHASIMSLPALLGTTLATIPARIPYIPSEPRPAASAVAVPPGTRAIGIVWAGSPAHARDFLRSAPLAAFAPLFGIPGTRFFSLQKGEDPEAQLRALGDDRVTDLAPHLEDLRDTAAVLEALDLVITVDTAVAHLAGALGRPTWLLLPHVPDFRWMLDREDSPWYPTMRLFRQPAPRDWESVFDSLCGALRTWAGEDGSGARARSAASHASDETIVALTSSTRLPDGRPRFDLWLPLARLADPPTFAAYAREVVGETHEPELRSFLDDVLRDGDTFVDLAPSLGLAALTAATAPRPPSRVVLVERDASSRSRLQQILTRRSPRLDVRVAPDLRLALAEDVPGPGHTLLRVGDPAESEVVASVVAEQPAARRPSAIVWPAVEPASIRLALQYLDGCGYLTVALSIADGEVAIDRVPDAAHDVCIVALTEAYFRRLSEAADADEESPAPLRPPLSLDVALGGHAQGIAASPNSHPSLVGSANIDAVVVEGTTSAEQTLQIGIDWELRADTGWGIYGTQLALALARSERAAPALFATDAGTLAPTVRHHLSRALAAYTSRHAALQLAGGAPLPFAGIMLRALGNNVAPGPLWDRVSATRNIGVIFFEDTAFDAPAIARARSLDLIVTGSRWNERVLRGLGVGNVATVLQGVDPTVFHPAPRSGDFAGRFVVFSGGKLEFRKGQDLVLAAFRRFRMRHPEALLLLAWHNGWPGLISDLDLAGHVQGQPRLERGTLAITEWIAANGIDANAVLDVGHLPNALMGQVVREADVALFPNRCEGGTNLVAMECMAAGVPTIVSANTGHLDLVATGGCLPLTHQRPVATPTRFFRGVDEWGESDVDEMVESLERIHADRAGARALAARGADVMRALSWPAQASQLLATITSERPSSSSHGMHSASPNSLGRVSS